MVTLEDVFNQLRSILRNRFRVALLDETKTATLSGGLIQTLQLRNHQEKSNTAFFTPEVTKSTIVCPRDIKQRQLTLIKKWKVLLRMAILTTNFMHWFDEFNFDELFSTSILTIMYLIPNVCSFLLYRIFLEGLDAYRSVKWQ